MRKSEYPRCQNRMMLDCQQAQCEFEVTRYISRFVLSTFLPGVIQYFGSNLATNLYYDRLLDIYADGGIIATGYSWHGMTDLCYHDGCRYPGAKYGSGHQHPPWWLGCDDSVYKNYIVQLTCCVTADKKRKERPGDRQKIDFFIFDGLRSGRNTLDKSTNLSYEPQTSTRSTWFQYFSHDNYNIVELIYHKAYVLWLNC